MTPPVFPRRSLLALSLLSLGVPLASCGFDDPNRGTVPPEGADTRWVNAYLDALAAGDLAALVRLFNREDAQTLAERHLEARGHRRWFIRTREDLGVSPAVPVFRLGVSSTADGEVEQTWVMRIMWVVKEQDWTFMEDQGLGD
ncbi:MAG: hypothetical protein Q4F67_01875 [Propionibacteriaceae bacterium]|nr:hypothetical protein [Propionibacteriaceae bacterium]